MTNNVPINSEVSKKIKTTILLDKTIKKLAQIYALQNDLSLGELIEMTLKDKIVE